MIRYLLQVGTCFGNVVIGLLWVILILTFHTTDIDEAEAIPSWQVVYIYIVSFGPTIAMLISTILISFNKHSRIVAAIFVSMAVYFSLFAHLDSIFNTFNIIVACLELLFLANIVLLWPKRSSATDKSA